MHVMNEICKVLVLTVQGYTRKDLGVSQLIELLFLRISELADAIIMAIITVVD